MLFFYLTISTVGTDMHNPGVCQLRNPPYKVFTGWAHPHIRKHACVNDEDSPDLTTLECTTQPTILQGFPLLAHHPYAPAYSVVVIGALGGNIISQRAIGGRRGGGISETSTEACSIRFSTTGLRKASRLSRFLLFTRRTPSFGNIQ